MNIALLALAIVFWPITLGIVVIRYSWPLIVLFLILGIFGAMLEALKVVFYAIITNSVVVKIMVMVTNIIIVLNNVLCLGLYRQKLLSFDYKENISIWQKCGKNLGLLFLLIFVYLCLTIFVYYCCGEKRYGLMILSLLYYLHLVFLGWLLWVVMIKLPKL